MNHLTLVTKPTPLNTILWKAQIKTGDGYRSAYYSRYDEKPISFDSEISKNHDLLTASNNKLGIRTINELSRSFSFIDVVEGGYIFTDMRLC